MTAGGALGPVAAIRDEGLERPVASATAALRVSGGAIVYRLHEVGYEIALEPATRLLGPDAAERVGPTRSEARAIQIRNPPITVALGTETVTIGGAPREVEVSARIFDFGVVSLRVWIPAEPELSWPEFLSFGAAMEVAPLAPVLRDHLDRLLDRIRPAIERPAIAPVVEEYVVYRIQRMVDERGACRPAEVLSDADVAPLLLNEPRPLSESARRELLPHRFSYFDDDLAILAWDNALVVEPNPEDVDVQYVLEFANAQLLELRVYDSLLDAELPNMYERVARARRIPVRLLRMRFTPLLADLQTLVADTTELIERVENSFKLTDDVYLARIYSAALDIFRGRIWRRGIDRKLGIIRETYGMLNDEAQASRAEALELAIVLLIVTEIVLAFVVR